MKVWNARVCLWLVVLYAATGALLGLQEDVGSGQTGAGMAIKEGFFLVLKGDGVPTMVEKIPGNLGSKTCCFINVDDRGVWKVRSVLGMKSDSTNVLSRGEVLLVTKVKLKSKSMDIHTRTERALPYDVRGRTSLLGSTYSQSTGEHANIFSFKRKAGEGEDVFMERVRTLFDIFEHREDIGKAKEISLGMSVDEVLAILGEPLKKAVLGDVLKYRYADTTVVFTDGRVSDVSF